MPSLAVCRLATVSDARALAALASETFVHTWHALVPDSDRASYVAATFTPETLTTDIMRPATQYLVLENAGELLGYARLTIGSAPPAPLILPAPALLDRFYLLPEAQGTGLAQSLLESVIAQAQWGAIRTLWLCHHPSNTRAERFYLRQGFQHTGVGLDFVLNGQVYHDTILTRSVG